MRFRTSSDGLRSGQWERRLKAMRVWVKIAYQASRKIHTVAVLRMRHPQSSPLFLYKVVVIHDLDDFGVPPWLWKPHILTMFQVHWYSKFGPDWSFSRKLGVFFVERIIIFQQSLWKSWRQRSRCWAICQGSALRTEAYSYIVCILNYMILVYMQFYVSMNHGWDIPCYIYMSYICISVIYIYIDIYIYIYWKTRTTWIFVICARWDVCTPC